MRKWEIKKQYSIRPKGLRVELIILEAFFENNQIYRICENLCRSVSQ